MNFYIVPSGLYQTQQKMKGSTKSRNRRRSHNSRKSSDAKSSLSESVELRHLLELSKHLPLMAAHENHVNGPDESTTDETIPMPQGVSENDRDCCHVGTVDTQKMMRSPTRDSHKTGDDLSSLLKQKYLQVPSASLILSPTCGGIEIKPSNHEIIERSHSIDGHDTNDDHIIPDFKLFSSLSGLNSETYVRRNFLTPMFQILKYKNYLELIESQHEADAVTYAEVRNQSFGKFVNKISTDQGDVHGRENDADLYRHEGILACELFRCRQFLRRLLSLEYSSSGNAAQYLPEELIQANFTNYVRYLLQLPLTLPDFCEKLDPITASHYRFKSSLQELKDRLNTIAQDGFGNEALVLPGADVIVQAITKVLYEYMLLEQYHIDVLAKLGKNALVDRRIIKLLFNLFSLNMKLDNPEAMKILNFNVFFSAQYSWYLALTVPFVRVFESNVFANETKDSMEHEDALRRLDLELHKNFFKKLEFESFEEFDSMTKGDLMKLRRSLEGDHRGQMTKVHIIDVESGNLRSLNNSIEYIGDYEVVYICNRDDFSTLDEEITHLIFPGVGNFGHFVRELIKRDLMEPVKRYVNEGRKLMGICVGLQSLFSESEESEDICGMSLLDLELTKFDNSDPTFKTRGLVKSVPHIGWNTVHSLTPSKSDRCLYGMNTQDKYYFVHSYAAKVDTPRIQNLISKAEESGWRFGLSKYGSETFIAAISKGSFFATQFHPEKSGVAGLRVIKAFLEDSADETMDSTSSTPSGLPSRRIIACLDVRTNDQGDLVVTKGDQYDVREKSGSSDGSVRNLGKPVELALKYYEQGADEITFLNITSFRDSPITDLPMLEVLRQAAKNIFVPLTVGGGIKDMRDPVSQEMVPALKVAELYFASGADKVSLGSEAVTIAEQYYQADKIKSGSTAIEQISHCFGNQAVVISIDPKRKYVGSPSETSMQCIEIGDPSKFGPNGEKYCYYQVTSQGGRKLHEIGALEVCLACEDLGAGEILLNSIDHDGSNKGFNLELLRQVKENVSIPVIASSGAGCPSHFAEVFEMDCGIDAALGAGIVSYLSFFSMAEDENRDHTLPYPLGYEEKSLIESIDDINSFKIPSIFIQSGLLLLKISHKSRKRVKLKVEPSNFKFVYELPKGKSYEFLVDDIKGLFFGNLALNFREEFGISKEFEKQWLSVTFFNQSKKKLKTLHLIADTIYDFRRVKAIFVGFKTLKDDIAQNFLVNLNELNDSTKTMVIEKADCTENIKRSSLSLHDVVKGCRCLEIDIWNSGIDDDEPIVNHGRTFTQGILLKNVAKTIKDYAFQATPYPLILSIENHCTPDFQRKAITIFKETFGKTLLTKTSKEEFDEISYKDSK
ncbi:imidazoleglycerol phosphate synthase, cyclase subunit [Candidozyma pseudohaemuli]|uniref:Imidazoleglycerol phosphate synthase, cyclase subunit n=1 Tax=Candidozyma pseudohaemuli TaxID=418784 RepID=A0A2P7YLJ0_9ASCO|nr:imidazoleglycerol phosphate synthase, cyclase subunit [[Candida] pseudohaemulonii]PSK36841.1 imidazoleglycerol phosphate synthase, cyclase subunit [[Candida] pseudohaemulonii]